MGNCLKDPAQTYNSRWFREEYMRADEQEAYHVIAEALHQTFPFQSVVDIGCGPALVLHHLLARGKFVAGIEGSRDAWDVMPEDVQREVWQRDLRTWDTDSDGFEPRDLVICTEVAEHLEAEYADKLVHDVVSCVQEDGHIFFTGAVPGQGGLDHVNEQPRWYWLDKFAAHGWVLDRTLTKQFKDNLVALGLKGLTWLLPNSMILSPRG